MKLKWNPDKMDFYVHTPRGKVCLRDFYMTARKRAGISVLKLENDSKLGHPTLQFIEKSPPSYKPGKPNNSTRALLAALDTLGYSIELD